MTQLHSDSQGKVIDNEPPEHTIVRHEAMATPFFLDCGPSTGDFPPDKFLFVDSSEAGGVIMGLKTNRIALTGLLTGKEAVSFDTDKSWEGAKSALDNWWIALKAWEQKETFERAFQENRMTVRAMADGKTGVGAFQVKERGQAPNPAADRTMNLAYGVQGIRARGTPDNFVAKQKNALGLHELSVSLLTHDRLMNKGQIKYYVSATYVFMPLPQEEDLQLFAILNGIAKQSGSQSFKAYARMIASKLTRVKSAYEYDMGTTYCDVADRATQSPGKFRYGMCGTVSTPNPMNRLKPIVTAADPLEVARRKRMATTYKAILASAARNEIVVAYRQHGDGKTRFPMFARRTESHFIVVGDDGSPTSDILTMDGKMARK